MENKITVDLLDAIKVRFLKSFFEDDFPERGMTAWLTKIDWSDKNECYELHFDFKDFEEENDKYFVEEYYPNIHTAKISTTQRLFTAKEAGMYHHKYKASFSVSGDKQNDELFEKEILGYLKVA